MEFTRHLSNYVGSAKNLEYHTEKVLNELDNYCSSSPSISDEYDEKVSSFGVDFKGAFFTSLRNMLVHEQTPAVTARVEGEWSRDEGGTTERKLAIKKEVLLDSKEMSDEARGYMGAFDGPVDMGEVIEYFQDSLEQLYTWLFSRIRERFSDEHDTYNELRGKTEKLQESLIGP